MHLAVFCFRAFAWAGPCAYREVFFVCLFNSIHPFVSAQTPHSPGSSLALLCPLFDDVLGVPPLGSQIPSG